MRCATEGIMYPYNALKELKDSLLFGDDSVSGHGSKAPYVEIPHAAWSVCRDELDCAFASVRGLEPSIVFVLGPLHKGPISADDGFTVYAPEDGVLKGSDWEIALEVPSDLKNLVVQNDDICSEECSLEIAAPYLTLLFPKARVCHLLAPGRDEKLRTIVEIARRDFPGTLFFISNNRESGCAAMWKEVFL